MTEGAGMPTYEVYALRFGRHENRPRYHNVIGADPHEGLMPLDFFVWAIVGEEHTLVVDTGFRRADAEARDRTFLCLPKDALARIGVDATVVEDVIITHLHYDHAGTVTDFPAARFHLQDLELQFATGRYMLNKSTRIAYTLDHVIDMVRKVYEERVVFHSGDAQIAPGVSVHRIGGHTLGLQCVRVNTGRGQVVLASDASHFYENMERNVPFPIVHDVEAMKAGFTRLRELADSPDHIVPGHDPLVMQRYPAPSADLQGKAVSLHLPPRRQS